MSSEPKLWLWKNFVDGRPEYWAFNNPYPCCENGDPITLGEPCGYALFKDSTNGRSDVPEAEVINKIKRVLIRDENRRLAALLSATATVEAVAKSIYERHTANPNDAYGNREGTWDKDKQCNNRKRTRCIVDAQAALSTIKKLAGV